jgi:hypothetical protein
MWSGKSLQTFQRFLLPPSSGLWAKAIVTVMVEAASTSEILVNFH